MSATNHAYNIPDDDYIHYSKSELSTQIVKNLRKIAAKINLKSYQSLRKTDLIKAIMDKQDEIESDREKLTQPETMSSDLSDLFLVDSPFSNFIARYLHIPKGISEV